MTKPGKKVAYLNVGSDGRILSYQTVPADGLVRWEGHGRELSKIFAAGGAYFDSETRAICEAPNSEAAGELRRILRKRLGDRAFEAAMLLAGSGKHPDPVVEALRVCLLETMIPKKGKGLIDE